MIRTDTEAVVITALTAAPSGHSFDGGFWTSHDCNGFLLADSLAPRLAECQMGRPGARTRARTKAIGGRFLVLSAALPTNLRGPLLPPWLHWESVGGRRLHAKFGVLRFTSGDRHIWRAFVTSANLTRGGMFRNLEVLACEESGDERGTSLAHELTGAFETLLGCLPPAQLEALVRSVGGPAQVDASADGASRPRAAVEAIREALRLPCPAPCVRVVHTLDAPRNLLDAAFRGVVGSHCVVVSPPYGADGCGKPAKELKRYLKRGATTHLVTGSPADQGPPMFSTAAVKVLGKALQVWRVNKHSPDDTLRAMHAKLVAIEHDGQVTALLGSANFSASGLGLRPDANRELCIRAVFEEPQAFWDWDARLGAEPWTKKLRPTASEEASTHLPEDPTGGLAADFDCRTGQAGRDDAFAGVLSLTLTSDTSTFDDLFREGLAVYYGEQQLTCSGAQSHRRETNLASLRADRMVLDVHLSDRSLEVPITFHPPPDDPHFWTRKGPIEADPEQDIFLGWLRQFRSAPTQVDADGATGGAQRAGREDDRYTIPLSQPLAQLARYRQCVRERPIAELERIYAALGTDRSVDGVGGALGAHELVVAQALLFGGHRQALAEPQDPLLQALCGLISSENPSD